MTATYAVDTAFTKAVKFVLNSEGGYVNDPQDPGGPTKCGIALNYNQGILKQYGITNANTMRDKMTPEIAKEIYYVKYWLASGADRLRSPALQYLHFDTAVNHGLGGAAKCLLSLSKHPSSFEGPPKNMELWQDLFFEYVARRLTMYTTDRNRNRFLTGWINRISHVLKNAATL